MNDLNSLVDEAAKSAGVDISSVSSTSSKNKSKSERVREYIAKHPEARNKEIAAALAKYSVSAADVGNVKTQLKKKAGKNASPAKSQSEAKPSSPSVAKKDVLIDATIGLDVLDAGIEFINKAGGLNEAQYALNVIRRIKSL
jgi:hypothetical protein